MKRLVRLGGLLLLVLCIDAHAASSTFTVSNTNDAGSGSLRKAILDANSASASCEAQTIAFNISGSGLHTIQPLSALPTIKSSVYIHGYSQPGSMANTLYDGDNAVNTIQIDGSSAGASNGLTLAGIGASGECPASASIIEGLVINNFQLAGIDVTASPCFANGCFSVSNVRIEGSFIGTDTTGKLPRPNGVGVHFGTYSVENIVGDQIADNGGGGSPTPPPALRNIISGNASDGIRMDSTSSDPTMFSIAHRIRGNYIGVDATGTQALPNGGYGIFANVGTSAEQIQNNVIAAHPADGVRIVGGQTIGVEYNAIGTGVGGVSLPNTGDGIHVMGNARGVTVGFPYPSLNGIGLPSIAHNLGAGLFVETEASVDVVSGWFGSNGGLGIDLAPRGVNPNDALDADDGPNELLNAPKLLAATTSGGSSTVTISGTLDTTPNTSNEIHFYISKACDPSGYGEGEFPSYTINNLMTDASGHATFTQSGSFQPKQVITATTRRFAVADPTFIVSEFSNCLVIGDEIFADGFGP